jgi:succinate dehydrogenase / fumarate reductase membrane anchor subunit
VVKGVRTAGSAHRGLGEWLVQRVTALYLAGFTLYLVVYFALYPIPDHAAWRAYFAAGPVRLAWALAVLGTLLHAWIGLRSIYMDYLHPLWLRFGVMMLTALALLALGLWAIEILLLAAA